LEETTFKTINSSLFIKPTKESVKNEYDKIYDDNFLIRLKDKKSPRNIMKSIKKNQDLPGEELGSSKNLMDYKLRNIGVELKNKSNNPYIIKQFHDLLIDDKMNNLNRNINILLNKLTPQNFDKLSESLIDLIDESSTNLKLTADFLYEHAIDSELYCHIYANLVKKLSFITLRDESSIEINFREYFVNKCKQDFTRELAKEINDEMLSHNIDSCDEKCAKCDQKEIIQARLARERRRSFVNAKLIGELYKLDMFEKDLINVYIEDLLMEESNEHAMERFCKLLKACGKYLDMVEPNRVNIYFEKIKQILIEKIDQIKPRVRFMILDLIDLRKNNWIPRHEPILPKKIENKLFKSNISKKDSHIESNSNTKSEISSKTSNNKSNKKRNRKSSNSSQKFPQSNNLFNQKETSKETRNNQKFRTKTKVYPKKHI
jgi:hypothetical protein